MFLDLAAVGLTMLEASPTFRSAGHTYGALMLRMKSIEKWDQVDGL